MEKVLMKKTVHDGKVYHRAGQLVEVKPDVAKWYLEKNFAVKLSEKVEADVIEDLQHPEIKIEAETIETKEEKKVYRKRK
jgi:hypothetical protein